MDLSDAEASSDAADDSWDISSEIIYNDADLRFCFACGDYDGGLDGDPVDVMGGRSINSSGTPRLEDDDQFILNT